MSRRRRLVLGATGLVVILILSDVVQTLRENNWYRPRVTQSQVRGWIKQGLPMGSTPTQTIAFLREHGLSPDNIDIARRNTPNSYSSDGFEQQDPRGSTLTASLPDAYPGFLVSGGIFMKFGFDAHGRLTRYSLRDVYTGM